MFSTLATVLLAIWMLLFFIFHATDLNVKLGDVVMAWLAGAITVCLILGLTGWPKKRE